MDGQYILPNEDYIQSLMRQLESSYEDTQCVTYQYYQPFDKILLTSHYTVINDFLDGAEKDKVITKSDDALLLYDEPRVSRLYGLVKNHKPIKPGHTIPELRSVVSNLGSTMETRRGRPR